MRDHDDDQAAAPVPVSGEGTPDLPPAPGTRRRARNTGRFGTSANPLPNEFFAAGVSSGRVRRTPAV
ncbi:hypothetical protein ACI2K4_23435 [Micromonospora sp. NPDC050397]|uniref:hypothetical protein n=1 Tax=Micromonospora sp. NPDC050397 TaxID=3364279 RepID=UPI00384B0985